MHMLQPDLVSPVGGQNQSLTKVYDQSQMQIMFEGMTGGAVEIEASDRQKQARCNTAIETQVTTTYHQLEKQYPTDFRQILRNTQENFFMQEYLRNNETAMRAGSRSVVSNPMSAASAGGGSDHGAEIQGFKKPVVYNQAKEDQYRMKKNNALARVGRTRTNTDGMGGKPNGKNQPRLDTQNFSEPETKEMPTPVNASDLFVSNDHSPGIEDYSKVVGELDTLRKNSASQNQPYLLPGVKKDPRFPMKYGSGVAPSP